MDSLKRITPPAVVDSDEGDGKDEEGGRNDDGRHHLGAEVVVAAPLPDGLPCAGLAASAHVPHDVPGDGLVSSSTGPAAGSLLLPVGPLTVLVTRLRVTRRLSPRLCADSVTSSIPQHLPGENFDSSTTARAAGSLLPLTELAVCSNGHVNNLPHCRPYRAPPCSPLPPK